MESKKKYCKHVIPGTVKEEASPKGNEICPYCGEDAPMWTKFRPVDPVDFEVEKRVLLDPDWAKERFREMMRKRSSKNREENLLRSPT